jgi:hypothetical protein
MALEVGRAAWGEALGGRRAGRADGDFMPVCRFCVGFMPVCRSPASGSSVRTGRDRRDVVDASSKHSAARPEAQGGGGGAGQRPSYHSRNSPPLHLSTPHHPALRLRPISANTRPNQCQYAPKSVPICARSVPSCPVHIYLVIHITSGELQCWNSLCMRGLRWRRSPKNPTFQH